jgi:hypothetical protein
VLTEPEVAPALGLSAGFEQPAAMLSKKIDETMATWRMMFRIWRITIP